MSVPGKKRGPYKPRAPKNTSAQSTEDLNGAPPTSHNAEEPTLDGLDLGLVAGGVSAAWLGHVFGHDKNTIKKKLAKCPVAGKNRNTPLYLIKDAAAWLVPPKVDVMTYIKSLPPTDLPPRINAAYWSAMEARQRVLLRAGELWQTEDVISVFGEAMLMIKDTVTLWVDEMDRVDGLTDKQRAMLERMSDGLLSEVHERLVAAPAKRRTLSTLKEYTEAPEPVAEDRDELV